MNNQIGLLLPRSAIYPTINFDLINGLRDCFSNLGISHQPILTENIGVGADDKVIYAACERMIMNEVEIIVGYVNPTTAEMLNNLFKSANAIFIALDSGYHFPAHKTKLSNVFSISLQGALCCSIATNLAINKGSKDFAYISSFYDAGYRSAFAFHKCIERSNANLTFNYITKLKRNDFTLEPLKTHLSNNPGDTVIASFCGDMLQDFFSYAASSELFDKRKVYVSSFCSDEQWLDKTIYPGVEVHTCVPWARSLSIKPNEHFKKVMIEKKHNVNLFAVLGWEAALVISEIINLVDANAAIDKLEQLTYNGPRGKVTFEKNTHATTTPIYLATIVKNRPTGNCSLKISEEYSDVAKQQKFLENDIESADGLFTSWHNVYGCLES